jgi:uncharacterized protein YcaQ
MRGRAERIRANQVAAFRLARHHLLASRVLGRYAGELGSARLAQVVGHVTGIQAQVMSAAELALWTRMHGLTRAEIQSALWKDRVLVKTSCMRQTLHLLPSSDFHIFMRAVRRSRSTAILNRMAKFGMTIRDAEMLSKMIVEALAGGPLPQHAVRKRVMETAPKNWRAWMERVWSIFKLAIAEGHVRYGPARAAEITLVRTDAWLSESSHIAEDDAKQIVLRRYLASYGPATLRDFSHWSGIGMAEARPIWDGVREEMTEVSVENEKAFVLAKDLETIRNADFDGSVLRLLPSFDSFLLAHAEKDHVIEAPHYKRVFRQAGWISPVILLNGRAIGLWSYTKSRERLSVKAEFLKDATKSVRKLLEAEVVRLGIFFELPSELS